MIRIILGKAKHHTRVVYVPSNHDEMLRDYDGTVFGNVQIDRETIHTTADNRKLLILHGDEIESVVRRKMGFSYLSLDAFLKHKVKVQCSAVQCSAVQCISNFEEAVSPMKLCVRA